MLVILRENVQNLGHIGDVVRVSDGYARNFLLPRNLVLEADEQNVAKLEHQKKSLEKLRLAEKSAAQAVADSMKDVTITLNRKVGEQNKLFGSVTQSDIADALKKAGHTVDKQAIQLDAPIKALGTKSVTLKLTPEVSTTIKVTIAKEE